MLCSPEDRYDNSIPTLFLVPIDCLKIPALVLPRVQFYPEGRNVRRKKCWKFLHQLVTLGKQFNSKAQWNYNLQ